MIRLGPSPDDFKVGMQTLRDSARLTLDSVVESGQPANSFEHKGTSASEGLPATRPSILVLDDRHENIAVIAAMLSGMDVNLVVASAGPEALELFDRQELALALLDVCMPEMDGFEVASEMRSRGSNVPFIFVTAQNRNQNFVTRAYSIGSADFLYKPLEPIVLRAKVQVFLDLFRLRHEEKLKVRELERLQESLVQQWAQADKMSAELARQNSELTLRNNQLNSFSYVVSHDLRQPLGSILDYLELIGHSSGEHLDADTAGWVKSCRRIGHAMQSLIDDVLDYSRLGGKPVAMSPVDTTAALMNALESLHVTVKESGAQISYGRLPTVLGSEKLLTSLLQNLIGNSIKYRGAKPPEIRLTSAWREDDRKWCFRIADNGRGFKGEDCERIFEMFGRGTNVSGVPGTGIGLATCKRIVEAHGGRIWAESRFGEGSEFYFVLSDGGSESRTPEVEK